MDWPQNKISQEEKIPFFPFPGRVNFTISAGLPHNLGENFEKKEEKLFWENCESRKCLWKKFRL